MATAHAELEKMNASPDWNEYYKDGVFKGYTMKGNDGFLAIKSTGILNCTPIEVFLLNIQKIGCCIFRFSKI